MTGGSRGGVAYEDSSSTWVEYGSEYSTMGQGDLEDLDSGDVLGEVAPFLASTKMIFDWIDNDQVQWVSPWDFDTSSPGTTRAAASVLDARRGSAHPQRASRECSS